MFLLALVVDATGQFIPCIGWIFPALVAVIGIGALILTRFGTQSYPADTGMAEVVDSQTVEIEAQESLSNDEIQGTVEE